MNILNIEYLGHVYTAQYKVTKDDHLVVHLPNGEMRETAPVSYTHLTLPTILLV